jgi:aminoglycoside 6'-N-acetyltransferase I
MIRAVSLADASQWEAMRRELWPDGASEHTGEIAAFFENRLPEPQAVLVAENGSVLVGFAELSIRFDIAGLEGKRVGFVEGLFVPPAFRHRGVARQLLQASREWARTNHCEAFASDRADRVVVDQRFQAAS